MTASIIITTRNRARFIEATLQAFRAVAVPDGLSVELLVVDNDSADETAGIVKSARLDRIQVRYVHESRAGKSRALNRALAETSGEMILFTDDDVKLPANWIAGMCEPMLRNGPCAVAGGVRLAPNLVRSWMTPRHRSWLASTEWLDPDRPSGMVGANMAFSREILRRVPGFDPELGPGALGFGEEQLFASQLLQAGFPIIGRLEVWVEHHFDPQRLLRQRWLDTARRRGRCHAYRGYHWEHWGGRLVRPRLVAAIARLAAWRARYGRRAAEGCPEAELELEFDVALLRGHLHELHRPRNYGYRSLVRQRPDPALPLVFGAVPAAAGK